MTSWSCRLAALALLLGSACGSTSPEVSVGPTDGDVLTFEQELSWSPDGRWIAFSQRKVSRERWEAESYGALEGTQYDLFLVRADGGEPRRLTRTPESELWTSWSPDGSELAFQRGDEGLRSLRLADGVERALMAGVKAPSWSPDGKWLAVTCVVDGHDQVLVVARDGSDERLLTRAAASHWNPAWSPDGAWIAFYTDRKGAGLDEVMLIRPDGREERAVTDDEHNDFFVSWSPDGSRLLFTSDRGGAGESVVSTRLDGSDLSVEIQDAFFARWSPDGSRLAFVAGRFPDTSIFVRDASGGPPRRLVE